MNLIKARDVSDHNGQRRTHTMQIAFSLVHVRKYYWFSIYNLSKSLRNLNETHLLYM